MALLPQFMAILGERLDLMILKFFLWSCEKGSSLKAQVDRYACALTNFSIYSCKPLTVLGSALILCNLPGHQHRTVKPSDSDHVSDGQFHQLKNRCKCWVSLQSVQLCSLGTAVTSLKYQKLPPSSVVSSLI